MSLDIGTLLRVRVGWIDSYTRGMDMNIHIHVYSYTRGMDGRPPSNDTQTSWRSVSGYLVCTHPSWPILTPNIWRVHSSSYIGCRIKGSSSNVYSLYNRISPESSFSQVKQISFPLVIPYVKNSKGTWYFHLTSHEHPNRKMSKGRYHHKNK